MNVRALLAAAMAAVGLSACHDSATIPHTPTTLLIVSGNNQSADVSTALDSSLVVRVADGGGKSVAGVALTWTVTGGGSLSATSTTTDANGQSSAKWTLSADVGTQVVTVTSTQVGQASVSFVAGNGSTITGTVAAAAFNPFSPTFSRSRRPLGIATSVTSGRSSTKQFPSNRIIIGFKNGAMGLEIGRAHV